MGSGFKQGLGLKLGSGVLTELTLGGLSRAHGLRAGLRGLRAGLSGFASWAWGLQAGLKVLNWARGL